MAPTPEALTDAILQSVQHGGYPDSEDVAPAELSAETLPPLLQALDSARDDIKTDIRSLSREAAPDIDGWITQAKQLQADIERSKATAREIVQQAEAGKTLQANINDASSKVGLLEKEVAFNNTLSDTLTGIRENTKLLDDAQSAAVTKDVLVALDKLEKIGKTLAGNRPLGSARVSGLLQNRCKLLRNDLIEETMHRWSLLVSFHDSQSQIAIRSTVEQNGHSVSIEDVAAALLRLELLDSVVDRFSKDFTKVVGSRFILGKDKTSGSLEFREAENKDILERGPTINKARVDDALIDFDKIVRWLSKRLPSKITTPLSSILLPTLVSRFIKNWLEPAVPLSLEDMPGFEGLLEAISDTAESIGKLGWAGREELVDWVDSAPRIWLTKRRESTLDVARRTMLKGLGETKLVERVETEVVTKDDVIGVNPEHNNDDWDAAWDDSEDKSTQPPTSAKEDEDDQDASAWDMEDESEESKTTDPPQSTKKETNGVDEEDAWGWGDDDQDSPKGSKSPVEAKKQKPKANGSTSATDTTPAEREVTLKETLTVTSVPDGILEIILQVVADAEDLAKPESSQSTIAPAAAGLYLLPTLVLAMYRATASTYYSNIPASNMFIYNDSARLSDRLRSFLREQTQKDELSNLRPNARPSSKLKLEVDIKALDSFSRRAYGQEMESQRTILRDHLDGAQGFANCTTPPFAAECENAVSMTVDRVREVHKQWKDILSRSALLQSVGSLVFTVISKVIADIKDMSDISEAESQRLRHFCDEISQLNDLFIQRHPDGSIASDMTLYVVPNWFRFQFLGQIMESSLADIVYMWTESELKLEYEADEIIDLIEALFAENEHRRKAIGEIRKSVGG